MSSDVDECVRTLVQAVFRLAFCDYIGVAYGHDDPGPEKWIRLNTELQADSARFLTSVWGAHLADLVGLTATTVWKQAQRSLVQRPVILKKPEMAARMQLIAETGIAACPLQPDVEIAA